MSASLSFRARLLMLYSLGVVFLLSGCGAHFEGGSNPSQTQSLTNYSHIKVAAVAYSAGTPSVVDWMSHRIDLMIGAGLDPRSYNSRSIWPGYVDSAFVYSNELYDSVKASARSHGFFYEDTLAHMNTDYQINPSLVWSNISQFDAFEQRSTGGSGSPSGAVNGAFLLSGGTYTDVTSSIYDGAHSVTISDRLLLGYAEPFDQVNFELATKGSRSVTWQYWNGTQWSNLSITSDGSASLSQNGQVLFSPPANWTPNSINGSRVKYWVQVTIAGQGGTSPVASKVYGDDWLSQTGSFNCRGWNANDSHRINLGMGNLEYNPTPPTSATARFRYQARVTGIWAPNGVYGNLGNIHSGQHTWAQVLIDRVITNNSGVVKQGGVMFDDGLSVPTLTAPSGPIENYIDVGSDTWINNGYAVYSDLVPALHTLYGAQFKVGVNTVTQQYALLGDWSLQEQVGLGPKFGDMSIAVSGETKIAGTSFDGYLAASNPKGTQGVFTFWNNLNLARDQKRYLGDNVFFDTGNRGAIVALATYYIAANPNTFFAYNTFGWSYFESDEVYYWSSPQTITGPISSDTSSAVKMIGVSDASAFAQVPLYNSIIVKLYPTGETLQATKVSNTQLSTTDPIQGSYSSGAGISHAITGHQSTDAPQSASNVWKWGLWFPAIAVDVGSPDPDGYNGGKRDLAWVTGSTAGGPTASCDTTPCSEIWRRDYTKAIILSRVARWNTPASLYNAYSVSVPLNGTYYPLASDGKTGPGITSIQLRAAESAILMKAPL